MVNEKNTYLEETYYLDYSNQRIQMLADEFRSLSIHDQIGGLFVKVRDTWRYNPYTIFGSRENYKASVIATREEGHCIDKSTLFITGLRALGIPARLRLAKVINHIAVERLTERFGTNHLAPHGIVEVHVNGKWFKASNAFNQTLCEKYNVDPLFFDGTRDAMIQPYNSEEKEFMEYVEDYGSFDDVPFDFIVSTFKKNYPQLSHNLDQDRFTI